MMDSVKKYDEPTSDWILVKDRLPTKEDSVGGWVQADNGYTQGKWDYDAVRRHPEWFTRWRPMSKEGTHCPD